MILNNRLSKMDFSLRKRGIFFDAKKQEAVLTKQLTAR